MDTTTTTTPSVNSTPITTAATTSTTVTSPLSPQSTTTSLLSPTSTTTTNQPTSPPPAPFLNPNSVLSSLQSQPNEKQIYIPTTSSSSSSSSSKRKRTFTKDLKHMMYGFGDVRDPLNDTVDLMEEIVFEYIQEMTLKAAQVSTKRGRFQTEDLVFLVRKDPKKYHRVIELLKMNEELKKAKRAFDDTQEPVDED